jgi:hypothetical protein
LSLAGQRQPELAPRLFEIRFAKFREFTDLVNATLAKTLLRHLADAGNLADIERREKGRLRARRHA